MGQDPEISALRSRRVWSRFGRAAHTGSATVMHSEQSLTIVKPVKGNVSGLSGVRGFAPKVLIPGYFWDRVTTFGSKLRRRWHTPPARLKYAPCIARRFSRRVAANTVFRWGL